jgi:ribose/xylose/arabinose/galactoside ABC-type transport system permease subunit/ABC-type branched-subunit amino acid transport system ATPase component
MTVGSGQTTSSTRPSRIVILGEAARRFLLRPETTALAAVIVLFIVFSVLSPSLFPTKETYISVMSVAAELGILSIGVTLLMIGGHFDLSVGAVLGLTSYVVVALMRDYGAPPMVAGPAALAVGFLLGALNGAIVVRFRIHSFVVTLGTMLIWRGVVIALTGGFPRTVAIPPVFKAVMAGPLLGGFRMSMFWFLAIGALGTFLLLRTKFGNWIQARGQNEQAARNLGVPVDWTTILLFALTSMLAAVVGIIQVARFASVDALRGEGMELQAVAVTVIGGTLLSGGYGSVIGTVLGAITFGMIQVGLVLAGAPGHFFRTLTGLIVVGAVILNTDVTRRMARSRPLRGFYRGSKAADAAITAIAPISAPGGPREGETVGVTPAPLTAQNRDLSGPCGPDDRYASPRRIEPVPPDAVPIIEAIKVSKAFGPTTALVDASLKAYAGRILALLGDNGAGKSTLIKILSGVFPPDRGELRFRGDLVTFTNPAHARQLGIATVFQDLAVCELLSITRNVVLGREPQKGFGPFRWFDLKRAEEMTRLAFNQLGVRWERDFHERGVNISGGERQSLAIARAMFFGSSLLILDEPTSALAVRQAARLLDHIARARDQGQAIILITHNFLHALSVADDLTVLVQGRVAAHFRRDEIELEELTDLVARVS